MNDQKDPVVIISYVDETSYLALEQAKAIAALGQPARTCYIISPQEAGNMKLIHDELSKTFSYVKRIPYHKTRKTKNGIQNEMFWTAADYAANQLKVPFIYLDPSCVPLKRGWVERITDEFQRSKLLATGGLIKGGDTDCGIFVRRRLARGAMFSHEVVFAVPTLRFLMRYTSAMEAQGADPLHYEIYCATEFQRHGAATDLIAYLPEAINFKEKSGEYAFDAEDPDMESVQRFLHPRRVVPESAVLVSGCADESLHQLIASESVLPPTATMKEINLAERGMGDARIVKRRRKTGGRRKGSKNKPKPTLLAEEAQRKMADEGIAE